MTIWFLALWLQMSAQPQIQQMYEGMCSRATEKWQVEGDYGSIRRYSRIKSPDLGECFIYRRNFGQVYWRGQHGEAILFPIGSPLDDITRAEFAEAAQRAADETDGKPPPCKMDDGTPCEYKAYVGKIHEPVDVPAVQEPTREPPDCSLEPFTGGTYDGWRTPSRWNDMCGSEKPMATTCADKSRILEHDENSPPKYWCRKVEF